MWEEEFERTGNTYEYRVTCFGTLVYKHAWPVSGYEAEEVKKHARELFAMQLRGAISRGFF